jgi:hypothetical protein
MLNKKILNLFFLIFISYLMVFYFTSRAFKHFEKSEERIATSIIHETMRDHFKLFLDGPLTIGTIGSQYFSNNPKGRKMSFKFISDLHRLYPELVGLNTVDEKGKIIGVYPELENQNALGKRTQNLRELSESFNKKESYWFSPPFKLFQGDLGFAFYVPIVDGNKLMGWLAPVSSSKRFLEKFRLSAFLKSHELMIKDDSSGMIYFGTSLGAAKDSETHIFHDILYGRKIIFQCWPKNNWSKQTSSWSFIIGLSFLLTLFNLWILRIYRQRVFARNQLKQMSSLLQMTSKEALEKLVEVHEEVMNQSQGADQGITFVSNLIEQIDLLQTLTLVDGEMRYESLDLGEVLKNQLNLMKDIFQKKNLKLEVSYNDFKDVNLKANRWLIQNSVIASLLSHLLIYARNESNIQISLKKGQENIFLTFHATDVRSKEFEDQAVRIDRRLEIARRILQLYQGELKVEKDLSGGLNLEVRFCVY